MVNFSPYSQQNTHMNIEPFKLERYYSKHEFTTRYMLSSSDCETMQISELLDFEQNAFDAFCKLRLGYTETKGSPELRHAISSIYSSIGSNKVLVCAAAQEPIFLFCHAVLKPDDEIIIQFPCYQSIQAIPESIGCKVKKWNVKYVDNSPLFDLQELADLVSSKTKVIFINSPHNPTGHHFTISEQNTIIELARKHNCMIFGDEVYRELEYKSELKLPSFADSYENAVSLGVMSKSYGLPGLRIGWVTSQCDRILEEMAILKEYTTICSSAPSEFMAGIALRNRHRILDRNLDIIHNNLSLLNSFFERHSGLLSWCQPNAGPISLIKLNTKMNAMEFTNQLIKEKSVLLLPGEVFDFEGFCRIGFGRKNMPEALRLFEAFLNENFY